jgi:hypothetical protein
VGNGSPLLLCRKDEEDQMKELTPRQRKWLERQNMRRFEKKKVPTSPFQSLKKIFYIWLEKLGITRYKQTETV